MSINLLEQQRLRVLNHLNILDSLPEPEFDDLARLASLICESPIALISLVDEQRQWFKAKVGLQQCETARDISFCTHAIRQDSILIVEDALQDERFAKSPLVTSSPHIRFYAGAPLTTPSGQALGTLCVIDHKPRGLSAAQIEMLKVLAKQVVSLIINRSLQRTVSARLENLIEHQQAGVLVEDTEKKVILTNHMLNQVFGLEAGFQNLLATDREHWASAFAGRIGDDLNFKAYVEKCVAENRVLGEMQFRLIDERWLECEYIPILVDGTLDSHLWLFRDITQRKRDESLIEYHRLQMIEGQRLSALGEMAGGLAHEINNPMTVIYGRAEHLCELAKDGALSTDQTLRYSKEIVNVTERVMKIVRGLRSFARSGESDPIEKVSAARVVNDTLEFCRQRIKESGVELRNLVETSNIELPCRAVQISQVILNLVNNAFDAVKSESERWIEIDALETSDEVLIAVTDSGPGIPKDIREQIFNPFFTTKPSAQGTGLGLSISKRIAADHNGSLELDVNSHHTRFVLRLPVKA